MMFAALDQIPQISLGTAAVLIFVAIAALVMLRGLVRILWGTLVLCAAGYAAFLVWQHSSGLGSQWFGNASWLPFALPAVAFIATLLVLRFLVGIVRRPPGITDDERGKSRRSPLGWALTLLLSLIPTALLCLAGATLLHHAGSVAELRSFADDRPLPDHTAFLAKLKDDVAVAIPAALLSRIDPQSEDLRMKLAKLVSLGETAPPKAIPVLEEPEMRRLILGDAELRRLAREGRYSEILRDPRLDRLLENPDLRDALRDVQL